MAFCRVCADWTTDSCSQSRDTVSVASIMATYLCASGERRRKLQRCWVHPLVAQRKLQSTFVTLCMDLREDENMFRYYLRMSVKSFDQQIRILEPKLKLRDAVRISVCPIERVTVTQR
ncbi:hypothetical protein PR048_031721 [Dryococelus australis]|uniref:Uncharacterized protein n=1 Tax=Dryococelus australis TaxID=614101 RepID=A0ABQ9G901_9NEOP|nr:hypothetical protein PR048_031721 [Dryococelus australis]